MEIFVHKILIVEDESPIRRFININLTREGFEVYEAASGKEALSLIEKHKPDLVLLDVMLPDMIGFEICQQLREKYSDIAVIMLTARGQDMDKIMGLELGADDYIIKPFNPVELVARIRAVLRRTKRIDANKYTRVNTGAFEIDNAARSIYKNGLKLDLTPREYNIIKLLMENPNKAFERNELLDRIWGEDYIGDSKTVDVHIRRLREKIEDNPSEPVYIETIWGYGYKWSVFR